MYVIVDVERPTRAPIGPFATLCGAQNYRGYLAATVDTTAMVCLACRTPDANAVVEDRGGQHITVHCPTANHAHLNGQTGIVDLDDGAWVRVKLGGVNYELDNGELVAPLDAVRRFVPYANPEQCPGCGCLPGDGTTAGCDHMDGCGHNRFIQDNMARAGV